MMKRETLVLLSFSKAPFLHFLCEGGKRQNKSEEKQNETTVNHVGLSLYLTHAGASFFRVLTSMVRENS